MKGWMVLVMVVLVFSIPVGCVKPEPAEPGKNAARKAPVDAVANTEGAQHVVPDMFQPGSFENPQTCAGCHRDIYAAWSTSMHAYAWENTWYQDDFMLAHQESGGATDMLCGPCHAPIAARTGLLPPADGSNFDETSRYGISCDFCHTVTAVEQMFNMGHVSDPGQHKQGPRGDGNSLYHEVEFSRLHTRAEFCGSCHMVVHPANGVHIIDTYEDWKTNDYGRQGITCQNCHMTPTPGVGANPGRSAGMGKLRDSVAFHGFIGGSSYIQDELGHSEQAELSRDVLRAAAELRVADKLADDGTLELTVDVHNVGAGHKIPTGTTYIRKAWLEVEVLDAAKQSVFRSGFILDNNHVDPDAAFFRLLFVDDQGQLTGKSWRAQGIGYDRRIPANGKETEVYRIKLPARGDYSVHARLLYRSFSQTTLDEIHLRSGQKVPPAVNVEMAKAQVAVTY
jgi:hypothetical protein